MCNSWRWDREIERAEKGSGGETSRELGRDRNRSDLGRRTWQKQLHVHCVFPNMFCFYLANDHDLWSLCFRRGGVLGCQSDSRHSRYVAVILKMCHNTDAVRIVLLWGDCYHAGMFKCEVDRQLWYGSRYWYLNHVLLGCAGQSSAEAGRMIAIFLGSVKALDLTGDGTLKRHRILSHWYWTSFPVGWRFSWLVFNF